MLGLTLLSLALMVVDHLSGYLDDVRAGLTLLVTPVVVAADLPNRTVAGVREVIATRDEMQATITLLEQDLLLLKAKTEKMAALAAENNRLRDLLGSSSKLQDNVLVAELIGVDPDPERHEVIVDKGTLDGAFVGQPVLDAEGLMGQVIEVSPYVSRVLLISDLSHSIPVQVVRSNLRLIAQGTGASRELELMHVQDTADIREGDLLVSSGLGDRFPTGYPVGVVKYVKHDPGKPFAEVRAVPTALLDRSRHVLLVFTEANLTRNAGTDGRDG
ncbi:MAG: rod shape-determining protein MreC [Pseudomonadota bacterium]